MGCGEKAEKARHPNSLRWVPVPLDLNGSFGVFKRHLQNLVGQVRVGVQLVQHLGEELSLEGEVHSSRCRQIRPAWIEMSEYSPFEPGAS